MTAIAQYLRQTEIFYQFTAAQLEAVAGLCGEASYAAGELICSEKSSSNELYIIVQGEVEILIDSALVAPSSMESRQEVVARLGRGQSFGEIALVDQGVRSASARAATSTRVLVIPRDPLMMLCETQPQLGFRLMYNLAADLAMKVRNSDMRYRGQLLDRPGR
jgi:CRP-like cAMP-binding protein